MSKTYIICSDGMNSFTYEENDTKIELIGARASASQFYYLDFPNAEYLVEEVVFEDDSGAGTGWITFKTEAGAPIPLKGKIAGARIYEAMQPIGAVVGIADTNTLAVQTLSRPSDVGWDLS